MGRRDKGEDLPSGAADGGDIFESLLLLTSSSGFTTRDEMEGNNTNPAQSGKSQVEEGGKLKAVLALHDEHEELAPFLQESQTPTGHGNNGEEWRYHLPDGWSCPPSNAAGIMSDSDEGLNLICPSVSSHSGAPSRPRSARRTALVVANKAIPMTELIRTFNRGANERQFDPSALSSLFFPEKEGNGTSGLYPTIGKSSGGKRATSGNGRVDQDASKSLHTNQGGRLEKSDSESRNVYYFEVTLKSGMAWVGLVPAKSVVTPDQVQVVGNYSAASSPHPFPILFDQMPGMSSNSIGLGFDGHLAVSGTRLCPDGSLHVSNNRANPWTQTFEEGDTIGCGWEVGDKQQVFFTRNGELIRARNQISGFDSSKNIMLPAVGMQTESTAVVGNFGLVEEVPLQWAGDEMFHVVNAKMNGSTFRSSRSTEPAHAPSSEDSAPPGSSRNKAGQITDPQPIARPGAVWIKKGDGIGDAAARKEEVPTGGSTALNGEDVNDGNKKEDDDFSTAVQNSLSTKDEKPKMLTEAESKDAKDFALELRRAASEANAYPYVLASLVELCRTKQEQIQATLQNESAKIDLTALLELNELFVDSINFAEEKFPSLKQPPRVAEPKKPDEKPIVLQKDLCPKVAALVQKRDIFSLICMLRGRSQKRLDAAWALMSFAKEETKTLETKLRNEIRSSGGMHSLLTLFMSSGTDSEVKLVSALAVAYLLPSVSDHAGISSGNLGLKVTECLRFLVNASRTHGGEISGREIRETAALALTHLWIILQPTFSKMENTVSFAYSEHDHPGGSKQISRSSFRTRNRNFRLGLRGRPLEQRQDSFELQELLESTVSLIVQIADSEIDEKGATEQNKDELKEEKRGYNAAVTVEAICAVECARPVAVREGLLKILVRWLSSGNIELELPAVQALRDLTYPNDEYMAGWIHSQIVNEGALPAIVQLLQSSQFDVRLAAAEILSRLSIAPHTRAAIVEANGVSFLVQLLVVMNRSEEALALAAGNALLQLAAGALSHASGWTNSVTPDKQDNVINDIVQNGAIEPLVSMAVSDRIGKVRLMSVEALRVISEDVCPGRGTRQKMCDAGAAAALGKVLKQDITCLIEMIQQKESDHEDVDDEASLLCDDEASSEDSLRELYHALRALANILEPTPRERRESLAVGTPTLQEWQDNLVKACLQTARSGGVESLLWMASLPIATARLPLLSFISTIDPNELLLDSCRSLASLCPLLLSPRAARNGVAQWATKILLSLTGILKREVSVDDTDGAAIVGELQLDALRGLCSLAEYEPLKIRIVDESLSRLLQMKNGTGDVAELAEAANQVCLALGFTDDEIDVQLAGNDPKLLADWFYFERSLLLQAMARDEVRRLLARIWKSAFEKINNDHAASLSKTEGHMTPIKENSSESLESSTHVIASSIPVEGDASGNGSVDLFRKCFENLGNDDDTEELRSLMLDQYATIYESWPSASSQQKAQRAHSDSSVKDASSFPPLPTDLPTRSASYGGEELQKQRSVSVPLSRGSTVASADVFMKQLGGEEPSVKPRNEDDDLLATLPQIAKIIGAETHEGQTGLLSGYPYPLCGTSTEKEWILGHQRTILSAAESDCAEKIHPRVKMLLDFYFPSTLIRKEILPLGDLRPDASFNFRAISMPERRYFSFRREGQVLSRVCEKHAAAVDSEDIHWTLGFSNSTFAGEFAETLVQALYRSPVIQGISFSRSHRFGTGVKSEEDEDDGSTLLANLAGSLPPWVTYLTFDNVLSKQEVLAFVSILKTMGHLSAGCGSQNEETKAPGVSVAQEGRTKTSPIDHRQGAFYGLAIKNSPHLGTEAMRSFFELLGFSSVPRQDSSLRPPLMSLKVLDLSGNKLGDEGVSTILSIVLRKSSECSLERLDLSDNDVCRGVRLVQVLRGYEAENRPLRWSGVSAGNARWCSPLHELGLASNKLGIDAALEVVQLLENDALRLTSLDLSANDLSGSDTFAKVLARSLRSNTRLVDLNLSQNHFSRAVIDDLIQGLGQLDVALPRLAFFSFDDNTPPLTEAQRNDLNHSLTLARMGRVEKYLRAGLDIPGEGLRGTDEKLWIESLGEELTVERLNSLDEKESRDDLMNPSESTLYPTIPDQPNAVPTQQPGRSKPEGRLLPEKPQPDVPTRTSTTSQRPPVPESKSVPSEGNMITVLFSAPLVWRDNEDKYQPIELLDFELERELLWQCFKEASMDIELSFDNATTERLQATITKCCGCLHFSGHGHPNYLTFEDGKGGLHWLGVDQLKDLIMNGVKGGGAPFNFVFVSACHSGLAGQTFVDAGVPHVVCCQQESQLMDSAALSFTRAFYLALAIGRTVRDSFEIGRQAVAVSPSVPNSEAEMEKFELLPKDGNHDVPVFDAERVSHWPRKSVDEAIGLPSSASRRKLYERSKSTFLGSARDFELAGGESLSPDQPLPSPPQGFLGRETDMYHVLNAILSRRLVNVVGETGIGRSSLVSALCHYINDRRSTIVAIDRIFFVRARPARGKSLVSSVITPLHNQLVSAGKARPLHKGSNLDDFISEICKGLNKTKALIVFDRVELLDGSEEAQDFPLFLSSLFRDTKNVRVLMTARRTLHSLGLSSLGGVGEHAFSLGPLNFKSCVRLFAMLCPHVHTGGERRRLLELLVPGSQEGLCKTDCGLTDRSKTILSRLGNGIPSRTFDAAYQMTKEEYDKFSNIEYCQEN